MIEIGVVSMLVVALVQVGKRFAPRIFVSETVPLWATAFAIGLSALNAYAFGGDVRAAVAEGVVAGLTSVGAYRAMSVWNAQS